MSTGFNCLRFGWMRQFTGNPCIFHGWKHGFRYKSSLSLQPNEAMKLRNKGDVIQALLLGRADVNATSANGFGALAVACQYGSDRVAHNLCLGPSRPPGRSGDGTFDAFWSSPGVPRVLTHTNMNPMYVYYIYIYITCDIRSDSRHELVDHVSRIFVYQV